MARTAYIRVDRKAFLAQLRAVLKELETYQAKVEKVEQDHKDAMRAWADKVVASGKYTINRGHPYNSTLSIEPDESMAKKMPKQGKVDRPDILERAGYYPERAIKELKNGIALLEICVDDDVSAYTYRDLASFITL